VLALVLVSTTVSGSGLFTGNVLVRAPATSLGLSGVNGDDGLILGGDLGGLSLLSLADSLHSLLLGEERLECRLSYEGLLLLECLEYLPGDLEYDLPLDLRLLTLGDLLLGLGLLLMSLDLDLLLLGLLDRSLLLLLLLGLLERSLDLDLLLERESKSLLCDLLRESKSLL